MDLAIVGTGPFFHILKYSISEFVIHSRDGQTYPCPVTNGIHSQIHQGLMSARSGLSREAAATFASFQRNKVA